MDSIYSDHTYSHCFNHKALPSDVQKVIVGKEHQQEWSSSLDQEDTKHPHIKEEQGELRISQDKEQLQGLEEADITKFPFTPVPVKSENDEEKPQFSQLHQRQTEQMETKADGEDCGGPEPAMNSDPDTHLQPDTDDETGDSSEPETDDSADWKETGEPQSGVEPAVRESGVQLHLVSHQPLIITPGVSCSSASDWRQDFVSFLQYWSSVCFVVISFTKARLLCLQFVTALLLSHTDRGC